MSPVPVATLPAGITQISDPLPGLQISTPAVVASVAFQGAHLTSWKPAGMDEVLFISQDTRWQTGSAIRGGIPVCFPWFGSGRPSEDTPFQPLDPSHGWARVTEWTLTQALVDDNGVAELVFELPTSHGLGHPHEDQLPSDAQVRYTLRIGPGLDLMLEIIAGEVLVDVEEALHTYFALLNVTAIQIEGLEGAAYWDKAEQQASVQEGPLTISQEVDRVYHSCAGVRVTTPGRTVDISTIGSDSTIVWNPWADKAASLTDFGDEEYQRMVCIESGNVGDRAITVPPGHRHALQVSYRVS